MPKKNQKDDRQVHEISVNVLQNEREACFPSVVSLSLRCRTRWWIEKERSIVCLAVVNLCSETTLTRPHQSSPMVTRKGNLRGDPSAVTEVTELYNERMMTLKSPALQCRNGLVA